MLTYGILTVSRKAAERALRSGDSDAAMLLIYMMLRGESADIGSASKELGFDADKTGRLSAILSGKASDERPAENTVPTPEVKVRETPIRTLPQYSGAELAQAMADKNYAFLCSEAERCLRRPLRRHECETLLALYEDAGMGADILAMVLTYVSRRAALSLPEGQQMRISFSRVREEAVRWLEKGINTVEKAELYIKELDELDEGRGRVRKLLGISGRRPSPTELAYIDKFLLLDPGLELIARAYDITVVNKGSLVWPYMRSILQKWHERGYKTAAEAEEGERRAKGYSQPASAGNVPDSQYEDEVLRYIKNSSEGVK